MAIRKTDKLNKEIEKLEKEAASMASTYSLAQVQANKIAEAQGGIVSLITKFGNSLASSVAVSVLEIKEAKRAAELQKKQTTLMESQLAVEKKKLELAEWELKQSTTQVNSTKRKISALTKKKAAAGGALPSIQEELDLSELKVELPGLQANQNILKNNVAGTASAVSGLQNNIQMASTGMSSLPLAKMNLALTLVIGALGALWNQMKEFVDNVRKVQQSLGVSTGAGAAVRISARQAQIDSAIKAIASGGGKIPISVEDVLGATEAFRAEFGQVLTGEAAANLARSAKAQGLTAAELAKIRRTFVTQAGGDALKAKQAEQRYMAEFARRGMTAKDAYDTIAQNSELFARNGIRFQNAFIRAAAEAKKIGVELESVSRFGDSIFGDYEGFLMGAAELGAMGVGLDTSRLAQIAATGSDADLFDELRSQLRNAGKDIFNLDRPTRMAVENFLGMPISQAQRLTGATTGSGEAVKTAEQLQADTNSSMANLVNIIDAAVEILNALRNPLETIAAWLTGSFQQGVEMIKQGNTAGGMVKSGLPTAALGGGLTAAALIAAGILGVPLTGGLSLGLVAAGTAAGGATGAYLANKAAKGDDVISKSGYGKRSLVTPSGVIALNNKDNIIAYADDFAGNARLPYGSISDMFKKFTKSGIEYGDLVESLTDKSARDRFFKNFLPTMANKATLGKAFPNARKGIDIGMRTVPTILGTIGKNAPLPLKYMAENFKRFPFIGSVLGGAMAGKEEYDTTGNMGRAVTRGLLNAGGGILGTGLGAYGGPVAAAVGGIGGSNIGDGIFKALTYEGGVKNYLKDNALGLASKIPGVGGLLGNINQAGGVGSFVKEKALGLVSKIPGIGNLASGALSKFAGGALGSFATGGLGTALSLASPFLGKIPVVGKTLSSIANAPGKLMGNALKSIGGLFGKKKTPTQPTSPSIGSMIPQMGGMDQNLQGLLMGSPMMANANALMAGGMVDPRMFMEMQGAGPQQQQQVQVVQDPELKQTIENAIKAGMANIGLHMDGTKVAQVLVGNMQGASTFNVLTR